MVAPIRELRNIISDTLILCDTTNEMASDNDVVMVKGSINPLFDNICDNYDNVCGCSLAHSAHCPRSPSMSSSECKESYAERMERQNNRMNGDEPVILTNSTI